MKEGELAELEGEDYIHLTRALRVRPGEILQMVDAAGIRFEGHIEGVDRRGVTLKALRPMPPDPVLPPLRVALCAPKAAAFEDALDAAVQLGATEFIPLASGRSQKLPLDRADRWQRMVRESCCQSLRAVPMRILPEQTIADFLRGYPEGLRLIAWQGGSGLEPIGSSDPVTLVLGPEGGFEESEMDLALATGWHPVRLGTLILRVPVALSAALGAIRAMRRP